MPFYEYACDGDRGCSHCSQSFVILQRLDDEPLSRCPQCSAPVSRRISAPRVVAGQSHRLAPSNLEKAGFTQYRKIGKGVYEKTAGKGPSIISDE